MIERVANGNKKGFAKANPHFEESMDWMSISDHFRNLPLDEPFCNGMRLRAVFFPFMR
jgi:hypothetical protein